jgi:DNA repair ATPase RecN
MQGNQARGPAADALRDELERLGFAPGEAGVLAERLVSLARDLPEREYRRLIEGVILGRRATRDPVQKTPELHRMLEDFAAELKKLDEGLRLLTAYLSRLREKTAVEPVRTLH